MEKERETQAPLFHDSWDRLGWVERQVAAVRRLAGPWSQIPERAAITVKIDGEASRAGYREMIVTVPPLPPLPPDINFIIGNIVTDARSCLDMAIDRLWNHYGLDTSIRPQFPLEDDFLQKRRSSKAMQRFLDCLDPRFVEVIEGAQPNHHGGIVDVPSNLSALFIGHLSNANKHRNITPVVLEVRLMMIGTAKEGLDLRVLDGTERRGVPPLRLALEYDPAAHSDEDIVRYVAGLEPTRVGPMQIIVHQRLVVDGHSIALSPPGFGGERIPWRVELYTLLAKVPEYVRLTLRNLNRVHTVMQSRDDNAFYMLDSDGTL